MSEQEKIDKLMAPRYKVIANYPDSKFKVNDIVNTYCDIESISRTWYISHQKDGPTWQRGVCDNYPHLFKKLEWFEDRTPEEMPMYLKSEKYGIQKVYKYTSQVNHNGVRILSTVEGGMTIISHWMPAAEAEYIDYQNKNK